MVFYLESFQNLTLLQNLYRLKAMGFEYIDYFNVNEKETFKNATTFYELSSNITNCHLCDLSKSRKQSMCGYGNTQAKICFVDYSVSQTQDATNDYFSGRSGKTLQQMIENVLQLNTEDIYLTHCIKCKPLNTNKPSQSEWNSCKNHLFTQLDFIKPTIIVTLGEEAYAHLTNDTIENFENVRGHVINYKSMKLIPIYHPQFLLRNPELKKTTLNDLLTIKSCL